MNSSYSCACIKWLLYTCTNYSVFLYQSTMCVHIFHPSKKSYSLWIITFNKQVRHDVMMMMHTGFLRDRGGFSSLHCRNASLNFNWKQGLQFCQHTLWLSYRQVELALLWTQTEVNFFIAVPARTLHTHLAKKLRRHKLKTYLFYYTRMCIHWTKCTFLWDRGTKCALCDIEIYILMRNIS